ncbi:hypothetical protein AVEN_190283-1 [Araneus ventricosus]|uniref:Uncharacterized protein n=1 Tax=Araneus ventricosus TaxID=182803 RepID=A0A4Y2IUK7_ARAVE|nr:hypothetical protein AVEN_190283-1 [Araneus ventricosus]
MGTRMGLVHELLPDPSLKNHKWSRFEIMFFTEHGPFTTCLHRSHLRSTDLCSRGEVGSPIHFPTSCPLASSWHFSTPSRANFGKDFKSCIFDKECTFSLNSFAKNSFVNFNDDGRDDDDHHGDDDAHDHGGARGDDRDDDHGDDHDDDRDDDDGHDDGGDHGRDDGRGDVHDDGDELLPQVED